MSAKSTYSQGQRSQRRRALIIALALVLLTSPAWAQRGKNKKKTFAGTTDVTVTSGVALMNPSVRAFASPVTRLFANDENAT